MQPLFIRENIKKIFCVKRIMFHPLFYDASLFNEAFSVLSKTVSSVASDSIYHLVFENPLRKSCAAT